MNIDSLRRLLPLRWLQHFALGPTDLLRDPIYRRLWTSILISSFGGQVTLLALPLTAAVLLHAAPPDGRADGDGVVPFVLFSLPTGVWLDRVRKLPVYVWASSRSRSPWRPCRWPGGSAGCRSRGCMWSASLSVR